MFNSLWSVVVAHERRRQDDSPQISMMRNFRTVTDEQVWQPRSRRNGVIVHMVCFCGVLVCIILLLLLLYSVITLLVHIT